MPSPFTQSTTPAHRVGFRQSQLRAVSEAQQKADEIQEILALRLREGESRQRREQETEILIEQVREARKTIEKALDNLQRAADTLRTHARRNPDDAASSHLVYANAHLRLTGALANGIRRTAGMERVLNSAEARREETQRRNEDDRLRRELRAHERHVHSLTLPKPDADAFDEVYGDIADAE